jgi:hypothetical protein
MFLEKPSLVFRLDLWFASAALRETRNICSFPCGSQQVPIPEAGLRRMDPSHKHPPVERVPPIRRRSAPSEVGDHRFHSIKAVRREPSGRK